jgi:GDPmannose 4,6-dehydratase
MKAAIFGSNGQDGVYLNRLLKNIGVEVLNISRKNSFYNGDVSNFSFVSKIISENKPDYIFHFAATSSTAHDYLFVNHETISTGTFNILESVKNTCPNCKVFISGSAMQFKNNGIEINEDSEFEASSVYSISRIQSVYAARYYRYKFNLKVYVGYLFNHDSELRNENHVNKKITSAVKRIASGSEEILELGNIDVRKEFNFAGDIVDAIWKLVNQDDLHEAVIGSGITNSIKEWTEYCFSKFNLDWKNHVKISNSFNPEYQILFCSPIRIKSIGWEPKYTFTKLADLMLEI